MERQVYARLERTVKSLLFFLFGGIDSGLEGEERFFPEDVAVVFLDADVLDQEAVGIEFFGDVHRDLGNSGFEDVGGGKCERVMLCPIKRQDQDAVIHPTTNLGNSQENTDQRVASELAVKPGRNEPGDKFGQGDVVRSS